MKYYYRSHATTHIRSQEKRSIQKKTIRLGVFFFVFLMLAAVYFIAVKDKDTMVVMDEVHMPSEKFGGEIADVDEGAPGKKSAPEIAPDTLDPWDFMLPGSHLVEKKVRVSPGDTLISILLSSGLAEPDAYLAVNTINDIFDPRKLRPGHELYLMFDDGSGESEPFFQGFRLKFTADREVQLVNCTTRGFMAREFALDLEVRHVKAAATIDSSLYQAAVDAALPIDILMQIIRAYSYDVDFQRDIQPGDEIKVLYEEKVGPEGNTITSGAVLYASLHTRGRSLPIYRHKTADGGVDFYDAGGKSVRKTLMVTPIDGARMSSGYGMRRHPIQGYNRMHRGLDFAAPTGTPIMAAGDGIVEHAGRKGSYGHYIRVRHPNEYHTAYAHLSRYASGIKSGVRVKQGQTIGYVGSTGVSTGPHLHYEVLHRRKHVNPSTVKTPPGRILEGEALAHFHRAKTGLEELYASLEKQARMAEASREKDKDRL